MALAELAFIIVTVAFVTYAVLLLGIAVPFKILPAGLAVVALGLTLGAGLAANPGVDEKIL